MKPNDEQKREETMKLAECGVCHFNIECDKFVAARSRYKTAEEFLIEAMKEDARFELLRHYTFDEAKTKMLPFVSDNAYVVHRVGICPSDDDLTDWWEFIDKPGRGHVKVWVLDMEQVEKSLTESQQ